MPAAFFVCLFLSEDHKLADDIVKYQHNNVCHYLCYPIVEAEGKKAIISEAASFYGGRIFTLLVEMFMMWLGYSLLSFNYWVTKIVAK